jgi:NCS2 family nucleobase:cation symporter-2
MAQPSTQLHSIKLGTEHGATRPPNLIYWLDDKPPLYRLLMLGFQHVAVICPYLVFATLILKAAHAPVNAATGAVGLAMLGIAVMTLLQVQG